LEFIVARVNDGEPDRQELAVREKALRSTLKVIICGHCSVLESCDGCTAVDDEMHRRIEQARELERKEEKR
jgi:hypothetical protein